VAINGLCENQSIFIGEDAECKEGNILPLGKIPVSTSVCNIETKPFAGGKLVRSSGSSARVLKKTRQGVIVLMPSKEEKLFDPRARATIGIVAASGRIEKPIVKAGKKWHMMKARNKLWPRTSAVKVNVIDHPFGSGRGKRVKSKIPKKGAPPGKKVGLLRPRRTGRRKK
jgi:large subunit ribosomal protein L2